MSIKMEAGIPDYINKELCETALAAGLNSNCIQIETLKLTIATKTGDNYCSDIYRANITFRQDDHPINTISIIIKAMPYQKHRGPVLDELNVFNKEVVMFMDILPKLSELCGNEMFSAKCYYHTIDPLPIIVFEDLKSLGFQMANRQSGLDLEHCTQVLKKIGKLHRASMTLLNTNPEKFKMFESGMFAKYGNVHKYIAKHFHGQLAIFYDEILINWKGYEEIADKLKRVGNKMTASMQKLIYETPSSIAVLNHGDLWTNNIMFKYDGTGKLIDVIMVDFQMSFVSSPGIDINYFLCTSPNNEVRMEHWDDLLQIYYDSFSTPTELNNNQEKEHIRYTFDMVRKEHRSREFYGFLAAIILLPLVTLDEEASKDSTLESIMDENRGNDVKAAPFKSLACQSGLKYLLQRFDKNGALDVLCKAAY